MPKRWVSPERFHEKNSSQFTIKALINKFREKVDNLKRFFFILVTPIFLLFFLLSKLQQNEHL